MIQSGTILIQRVKKAVRRTAFFVYLNKCYEKQRKTLVNGGRKWYF